MGETPRITPDLSFLSYSRYNRGTPRTPLSPRTPRTPRSSRTGGAVADYEPRGIRAELGHLNSPRSRSVASRDVSSRRNGGSVVSSPGWSRRCPRHQIPDQDGGGGRQDAETG